MIYLGQSLILETPQFEPFPVIYVGEDTAGDQLMIEENGTIHTFNEHVDEITFLFQKDPTSPTGRKIYYGGLCRFTIVNRVKMKTPDKEQFDQEFKTIKKLIKSTENNQKETV